MMQFLGIKVSTMLILREGALEDLEGALVDLEDALEDLEDALA
ncbi:hypothetical protein [Cytobacillus citreus]|nr:hypothetical protein [Cytobacillus citreus]